MPNTSAARKQELSKLQATMDTLFKSYQEEDILCVIIVRCEKLSEQIKSEGNQDAAFYWKQLARRLKDALQI